PREETKHKIKRSRLSNNNQTVLFFLSNKGHSFPTDTQQLEHNLLTPWVPYRSAGKIKTDDGSSTTAADLHLDAGPSPIPPSGCRLRGDEVPSSGSTRHPLYGNCVSGGPCLA
ncbi:hypothetical protein BaRGS_00000896, partial [Batillaria attramentaria]